MQAARWSSGDGECGEGGEGGGEKGGGEVQGGWGGLAKGKN